LTSVLREAHTGPVTRARRHHRVLGALAFGLAALIAELVGRGLTEQIDLGRHVQTPGYASSAYYPFLLAAVKVGVALTLARLAWRFAKARAAARGARRLLAAVGARPATCVPRMRLQLSPRLWLCTFVLTSLFFLVQTDAEAVASGRWPLFAPWLHTSALPVFAVLSVVVALVYGAVARWLTDYERYARAAAAEAHLALSAVPAAVGRPTREGSAPRQLFGLAFQVRPPPVPA
jgi:hypothetical protein